MSWTNRSAGLACSKADCKQGGTHSEQLFVLIICEIVTSDVQTLSLKYVSLYFQFGT